MNPIRSLRRLFRTPQQREIDRRLALAAAGRKVTELDRYCDERDRRISTKTAQAVEFKRQGNEPRGVALLKEIEDDEKCLNAILRMRRFAQKAHSRLELNRIGGDIVLALLPLLDQALREIDPRTSHEAEALVDQLERKLDAFHSVDASETVEESARLKAAFKALGSTVPVPEAAGKDGVAETSDPAIAPLQERLRRARERLAS